MGKRGPKPQGPYEGKTEVFSTRLRPDTKAALQIAASIHGWTLSQEVEDRIRRTFIDDASIDLAFGNRQNFALMRMVAAVADTMMSRKESETAWTSDPELFDQIMKATVAVLEALRPEGKKPEQENHFLSRALHFWNDVRQTSTALPIRETLRKRRQHLIRSDLGDLPDRVPLTLPVVNHERG